MESITTLLIAGLALATLNCVLLGLACYRLVLAHERSLEHEASMRKALTDERDRMSRFESDVLRVLNNHTGGISKRMSESLEIAEAIHLHSPELFKRCEGLAYWLHANDQFLAALYAVAAERIDREHRRRINDMRQGWQGDVFRRIYEGAALPPPPVSWGTVVTQ